MAAAAAVEVQADSTYRVGTRIVYQVEGMACPQEATIAEVTLSVFVLSDGTRLSTRSPRVWFRLADEQAQAPTAPAVTAAPALLPALPVLPGAPDLALRPLPETLPAAEARILGNRALMAAGAVDTARCVAHAREQWFGAGDTKGWLQWCADRFGIRRRQAFTCLAAGRLLASHPRLLPRLATVDLDKLDAVAGAIRDPDQQAGFMSRVDLAAVSRDDLRAKLALWDPALAGDKDGSAAAALAARASARKARVHRTGDGFGPDAAIEVLAGLDSDEPGRVKAAAMASDDPWRAVRAGFVALDIAVRAWQHAGARPKQAQAAACEELIAQFRREIDGLAPGQE